MEILSYLVGYRPKILFSLQRNSCTVINSPSSLKDDEWWSEVEQYIISLSTDLTLSFMWFRFFTTAA